MLHLHYKRRAGPETLRPKGTTGHSLGSNVVVVKCTVGVLDTEMVDLTGLRFGVRSRKIETTQKLHILRVFSLRVSNLKRSPVNVCTLLQKKWIRRNIFPIQFQYFIKKGYAQSETASGQTMDEKCSYLAPLVSVEGGGDVAQLVEHLTGTLPTYVRFRGAARNFSLRVIFQCRLS